MASNLRRLGPSAFRLNASLRHYSNAFGYTQAKALIFTDYGQPKDVLKYAHPQPPPNASLTYYTDSTSTQSLPHTIPK